MRLEMVKEIHPPSPSKFTPFCFESLFQSTCQKVTQFDEPYKTACFWGVNETSKDGHVYDLGLCKFVENFHVFSTTYLRRRNGPAVPERDLQNMDGEKIDWRFFQTTMTHVCVALFY